MTVIMIVTRMGRFFFLKLRNSQTSTPPKIMRPVMVKASSGMRLPASLSSRRSTSAVTPSTTASMSPPQRRARRVRVPRGGKGTPSLLPSASPVSGSVEGSSVEVAVPGWVSG